MAINSLGTSPSALQANQYRQNVSANNVANVNTDGFKASTVATSDAAYINGIGQGTQVTGTYAPPRPGPLAANAGGAIPGMTEQSNTDMVTEATSQMSAQNAYGVNAAMLRTANEMTGSLLNMKA